MPNTTTLTGSDRYEVYPSVDENERPTGMHHVWDHENADKVADRDGATDLTETDAHDLRQEYIHS